MSVLIKGTEMPTRCEDCFCYQHNAEYDYAYCNISSVNVLGNANARLNNCPLVPVPKRGDLIDRDALFKEMERKGWYDNADRDIAEDLVLDAPTIIEGDEE